LAVERLFGLCAMDPRTDKIPGKFLLGNFLRGKSRQDLLLMRSLAVTRFRGGRIWAKVHEFSRYAEFFSASIDFLEI
jgi:hypothetical protein